MSKFRTLFGYNIAINRKRAHTQAPTRAPTFAHSSAPTHRSTHRARASSNVSALSSSVSRKRSFTTSINGTPGHVTHSSVIIKGRKVSRGVRLRIRVGGFTARLHNTKRQQLTHAINVASQTLIPYWSEPDWLDVVTTTVAGNIAMNGIANAADNTTATTDHNMTMNVVKCKITMVNMSNADMYLDLYDLQPKANYNHTVTTAIDASLAEAHNASGNVTGTGTSLVYGVGAQTQFNVGMEQLKRMKELFHVYKHTKLVLNPGGIHEHHAVQFMGKTKSWFKWAELYTAEAASGPDVIHPSFSGGCYVVHHGQIGGDSGGGMIV